MAYAIILDGEAVEIHVGSGFTDANGIQHPSNWNEAWSPQEKVARGLRIIQEPADPEPGVRRVETALQVVSGHPVRVADDEPIPLAELKAEKLQAMRARRWAVETSGLTINGLVVPTDEKTQNRAANAVLYLDKSPGVETVDWEISPTEDVVLDLETLTAIATGIGAHVQACFTRSKTLKADILAAEDAEALAAIDINAGWPG
jgi:hypothetical protein